MNSLGLSAKNVCAHGFHQILKGVVSKAKIRGIIQPDLPGMVPAYTSCPGVIVNNDSFHS